MRGLRGEVLPPAMEMNLRAQSPLCSRGRPALVVRPSAAATGLTLVSYGLSCCFLPLFAFWSVLFVAGCSDWWVGIREKPLLCLWEWGAKWAGFSRLRGNKDWLQSNRTCDTETSVVELVR